MSMLRLNDRLLGRFRVDAEIAEGGMAVVYRGFDLEIDQTIAIKVLRPDAVDSVARFEREAAILATLDHPGVVRYVAHGVAHEGSPFLVTEWIEGATLADYHARVGLAPAEAVALVRRIAGALGAAHARGLVHRDIKPENLLLAGGELARATVIDFGLVRPAAGERLTETGLVVGTPGYMAPEQAAGARVIDPRSDVFALGCVLYECLTGAPAFPGRNAAAVMARIVLCEPVALAARWPDAPPALAAVVARMLAKRPDERPRDGAAVAGELGALTVPDAPRRRRASTDDAATAIHGRDHATAPAHAILLHRPDAAAALAPIVAAFGASACSLVDGTTVVVVPRDAAGAADCALAIAGAIADAPIVLAAAGPDAPLAAVLDAGAGELERADLERIFGGARPCAIRVDPATARQLAGRFELRADGNAFQLIGRRS